MKTLTPQTSIAHLHPALQRKMRYSIDLLRKAEALALRYNPADGYYLAFSGGKDSQCLYHVAQLAGVKFKAHFSPTSVDPPQLIRFIKRNYPDVRFHHIKRSIYDVAVEHAILPTMKVRWCCAEFKENAGSGNVTLIGIRHAESSRRVKRKEIEVSRHKFSGDLDAFGEWQKEQLAKKYKNINHDEFSIDKKTEVKCISGKDSILVSPIIDWTEADVWDFLNGMEIGHCELYDMGYPRIGCILCPMSARKYKLRDMKLFPHVKEKWIKSIMTIRNGGRGYAKPNSITPPLRERKMDCKPSTCTTTPCGCGRTNRGLWANPFAQTMPNKPQTSMGWKKSGRLQRRFLIGGLAESPIHNGTPKPSCNSNLTFNF